MADRVSPALQCVDLGAFDVHLDIGDAPVTEHIVDRSDRHFDLAIGGEDGTAAGIVPEPQATAMAVQPGVDGMDPRLIAEIGFELGKSHRVGLESINVGEPPVHPFDEAADRIAVIGAAVDVDFVVGELEQAFGSIEIVRGDDRPQYRGIERSAKPNHRFEHLTRTIVRQTIVQRPVFRTMAAQILEQILVEHVRGERVASQNLQHRERHYRREARSAQPLRYAQHPMRGNNDRRRLRQFRQALNRRDRDARDDQTLFSGIIVDDRIDFDVLRCADASQPLSFRRGTDDGD